MSMASPWAPDAAGVPAKNAARPRGLCVRSREEVV